MAFSLGSALIAVLGGAAVFAIASAVVLAAAYRPIEMAMLFGPSIATVILALWYRPPEPPTADDLANERQTN